MFWGLTPALDFLSELKTNTKISDEVNILIIGGADARHVLKTLSQRYRHEKVKINFYIMEAVLETIAKQLLLLNIALQPPHVLGLVQKTHIFMEVYGNTLIRPSVFKYFASTTKELIKMITDYDYLKKVMPFVTVDLKYKERDYLENVFKFWVCNDEFNVCEIWDKRLRKLLGVRYDSKVGAFDWDLHMRLHPVGGMQVCSQEYRHWRQTGVAFTWLESEVSKPNRSLVCCVVPNGPSFCHYGFLGDMQTGPYVTFGLDCEDKEFLKRTNGQNTHRATDVTERNLKQLFHEIGGEEYVHKSTSEFKLGCAVMQDLDARIVDVGGGGEIIPIGCKTCVQLDGTTINFISIDSLKLMKVKGNFQNFFNLIYFGGTYLKYFDPETIESVADLNSLLIVENQLFVLNHRDEQLQEFEQSVRDKVGQMQKLNKFPFDCKKDCYARFLLNSDIGAECEIINQ